MSKVDDIIRERLRKLKCDDQAASSSLAKQPSENFPNLPKKTTAEDVEDLLLKLSDEVVLDGTYENCKSEIDAQIRRRLERLKEWDLGPPKASFKAVVNEVLSRPDVKSIGENEDDQDSGKMSDVEDETSSDDSDAPPNYCVFCNKAPTIVCIDCYKDSYCTKCFNEFHEHEDKHSTFAYVQKKKK